MPLSGQEMRIAASPRFCLHALPILCARAAWKGKRKERFAGSNLKVELQTPHQGLESTLQRVRRSPDNLKVELQTPHQGLESTLQRVRLSPDNLKVELRTPFNPVWSSRFSVSALRGAGSLLTPV
jgi:hypothetical protein